MNHADDSPEGIKAHQEYVAETHRAMMELRELVEPTGWFPVIAVTKSRVPHATLLPLLRTMLEAFPAYTFDTEEKLDTLAMLDFAFQTIGYAPARLSKPDTTEDFNRVFSLLMSIQESAPPEIARNADHVLEYVEYFIKAKQTNNAKLAAGDVPPEDIREYLDLENKYM